ncbi:hypothetical protein [uncultured Gilvimarinus sp.]|uniref:DUF748 domain-containing protein n=1 Tax=uncultured Gilvimarinus sp. TaxID=1689143 RepID=UPI0030ECB11D
MKASKIILIVLLLIVVAVAGGLYYLFSNLDSLVESGIEKVGTDVTKTQVDVDRVHIELLKGRGEIYGLSIANPPGYSSDNLFQFSEVALQIEPASVRSDVIVLNEVLIDGVTLNAEHDGATGTNVQEILDNVRSQFADGEPKPEAEPQGQTKQLRFMIEKLSFTNTQMSVISPSFKNRTVTLEGINQSNIGSREEGLTPQELALAIVKPLMDKAQDRLEDELRDRAIEEATKAIEDKVSESDKKALDGLKSMFSDDK